MMTAVFATRLDEALETRKAEAVARSIGISGSRLSNYRTGRRLPRLEVFYLISKELGVSADWLLGLSDTRVRISSEDVAAAEASAALETVDHALELFERRFAHAIRTLPPDLRQRVAQRLGQPEPERENDDDRLAPDGVRATPSRTAPD